MRFASFFWRGANCWGQVDGKRVSNLTELFPTLRNFIASPAFSQRDALLREMSPEIPVDEVRFLPLIPDPEKIICVVRNYLDHHQEAVAAGLKVELSRFPPIFLRYARSQVGHGQPMIRPLVSEQLDFEGELAVVLCRGGRHISQADAMNHVAGYSIYNDGSIRDYQFHAKQIAAGKNFDGTGAFGPWLVTADMVADPHELRISTRLNGKQMQSSSTRHMIFKIPQLISYASTIFALVPGDVLVTGTPAGVGFARDPPVFMKQGDVVEVEVESIGVLRNPIEDESALTHEVAAID